MTVLPRTGDQQGQPDQQKETPSSEGQGTSKPVTQNEIENEESPQKTSEVIDEVQQKLEGIDIDKETQVLDSDFDENGEPVFPNNELARLDEMVNRPKWVIPVLPNGELEVLIDAAIKLSKKGLDTKSESCQRFIKDGMTISFNKIFLDDAVSTWKFEIHKYIMRNAEKLIELCVVKLSQDWFPLLDLLAVVLDPKSRFHQYNASRTPETIAGAEEDKPCYAKPSDHRQQRGWLVDLINKFGSLGGFDILKKRLCEGGNINIPVICAHLRPFGQCADFLTIKTIEDSLMPCVQLIKKYMEGLTDEELKKESKQESKNEVISTIIRSMKNFASRLNDQEEFCKQLEKLRLQMILRLLQVSSFNGKMNALNEINRVISNVSYYGHRHHGYDDIEYLTMEMVAEWLQENRVLSVVLKDNLHQPQYVEKLDKIIRFAIKVKTLTLEDLDTIWNAQIGKHEAIVKNVHDLLAKLAWDFSAEQLDHLFSRFQASWKEANKKQQEKLLELIRRLAEDDKEGVIAHKVLWLLWHLAHSDDLPTDIMDQALVAHIKILDFSCSQTQDRDNLKLEWIKHSLNELRNGRWVIPALKQIKAICELFYEGYGQMQNPHVQYRNVVIEKIQSTYSVVSLVAENLATYMENVRELVKADPNIDPQTLAIDGRYTHTQQIQERLDFLRFILNDGKMWLCEPQAKQIWICLAVRSVFACDTDVCFIWFSKVMSDDPDLDPEICKQFFEDNVFKLDASKLNEHGLRCFERFFKYVNTKEGILSKKRNGTYVLESTQLVGYDYLWKIILNAPLEIANKAIEILKEIYTNLGTDLKTKPVDIHNKFIKDCMNRLNPSYDVLISESEQNSIPREARKIVLCLKTLKEYVAECDKCYPDERSFLPHERACRGKHITLFIRFSPQARQSDDFEIWSHTNESLASVRRIIYNRLKMSPINVKLELHFNGEILSTADDRKLVGQIPFKDRTIITVKLGAVGGSSPSSPDSSSDSSPPPTPQPGEGPNLEAEHCLPGVVMSKMKFANSLFLLGDLGMKHNIPELRDIALSLLNIIPTDVDTIRKTRLICEDRALKGSKSNVNLDILFFTPTPINVLYNLQVVYSLLMPSAQPCNEISTNFQLNFISAGGIKAVINMLTKSSFMSNADTLMQRSAYQTLLKIAKLMFTVIGYAQVQHVAEALQKEPGRELTITAQQHSAALVLQSALKSIPNLCQECVVRNIAYKLGLALSQQAIACIPDMNVIEVLQRLAWVSAVGFTVMAQAPLSEVHLAFEKGSQCQIEPEDIALAREALEVLTIAIMLFPSALDSLTKDRQWQLFINDMILICRSRTVRVTAAEQFFLMATKCTNGDKPIRFFIQLLFTVRDTVASEHAGASCEYFGLLCRLLNFGRINELQLNNSEAILGQEISWLASVWEKAINSDDGREIVNNELLEGHLGITRELLSYQTPQKRYFIGSDPDGHKLLRHLTDDFIFSGSRLAVEAKRGGDIFSRHVNPICETPGTIVTALDLLVSLCSGCVLNLRILSQILIEMYYEGIDLPLTEWEYQPPIGPRPARGFVGLKNAGATCYMNSVIQQLYMIPEIRAGILEVDVGPLENEDEHLESDEKTDKESFSILSYNKDVEKSDRKSSMEVEKTKEQERKEYNQKVLRQVQGIFGHLLESKLQFHIPRGFWKTFRLWGEPVNLREQHDALEFFNSLVENLDEGLKALNKKGMLTEVLGGSFADQKICKTCPHRYSRETPFTALNVDVRNHHTLIDSLEQYVKGDLLEGANAYHCERCDKKVDTVKRMCIKKLPKVLAIHLKRFDYDWERDCAIKFNDYFEFPRQFDMEPFTVEGLAKIEGEIVEDDRCEEKDKDDVEKETIEVPGSTVYNLVGVVVHSGQASGGHYYSYIIPRPSVDGESRWYKFDDGDVSECIMDEDEMKNQCFGGEYMGEVFDHMLKRMSYRRQKRWWNAYILFYERLDVCGKADRTDPQKGFKMEMPGVIERSVRRQNILFMHNRTQFSAEYFQFIKKLVMSNTATFQSMNQHYLSKISQAERDELALLSLQLLCKFLFMVGFHTKKNIRGPASEWGEVLSGLLKQSAKLRQWFAIEVLLSHPERMVEYLIDCPVAEIRSAFAKVIVYLAHATRQDGLWNAKLLNRPIEILTSIRLDPETSTLSDYILKCVLELINKDVTDSSKYLVQYFQLFVMYVGFGVPERKQLLDLGVLQTFIRLAFEDERSSTSRYPYSELTKLYSLVSILIRSCDVSKSMKSSIEDNDPKPNRFYDSLIDHPIMPIPQDVEGLIYTSNYVKKLLEESASSEETICLLKFLSWECLSFSLIALSEVLFQISYTYSYELRPYLDILLHLLLMEDSWQTQRLHHAFRGRWCYFCNLPFFLKLKNLLWRDRCFVHRFLRLVLFIDDHNIVRLCDHRRRIAPCFFLSNNIGDHSFALKESESFDFPIFGDCLRRLSAVLSS
ncbi:probable ubiquitin carboxyl-terminal hydrolase FAF-X isoform X1 [Rhopilema esculentum]|uniref:probable ubiquitin carboxyl-terminal hydrolase FAF-X isoform X1 n=1 Tax=Rhopilema esculentum TaxID=499914 RepID=UPI0031D0432B